MGTLFIGLTKNGEPLLAPLSDAASARLKTIPRISNNPHIICGEKLGQPLTSLGPILRRVATRAGLHNIRVHDLRRTVGSWLAQPGVSLHLIGDILNHRDLKTTLGYACFQTEHRRDGLNAHGGKVLSFVAAQLRLGLWQTTLSAGRGDWARVEAGQRIGRTPLPSRPDGAAGIAENSRQDAPSHAGRELPELA
jgi:hypothetical protein